MYCLAYIPLTPNATDHIYHGPLKTMARHTTYRSHRRGLPSSILYTGSKNVGLIVLDNYLLLSPFASRVHNFGVRKLNSALHLPTKSRSRKPPFLTLGISLREYRNLPNVLNRPSSIKVTRRGFRLRKSWCHPKSDPEGPWTAISKAALSSQVVFIWPSCREFLDI